MVLGETFTQKFELTGRYEGEWVELKMPDASVSRISRSDGDSSIRYLFSALHSWSVVDKNGRTVPITAQNLEKMPIDWFNQAAKCLSDFLEVLK